MKKIESKYRIAIIAVLILIGTYYYESRNRNIPYNRAILTCVNIYDMNVLDRNDVLIKYRYHVDDSLYFGEPQFNVLYRDVKYLAEENRPIMTVYDKSNPS